MIIDTSGNILDFFLRENGIVQVFGEYSICVEYTEDQKLQHKRIVELKELLSETDYKALKFADGALAEEEYAPVRQKRQAWRDEINEIEKDFSEPELTTEEAKMIIALAERKLNNGL